MITLSIDASTYAASVAVLRGGAVLADARVAMRGATEERLLPALAETLGRAGVDRRDVARLACGAGPGSFTSLRIAASLAKGLASGLGVPLHAVPSLALVVAASDRTRAPGRYVAALDALRGEHYVVVCAVGDDAQVREVGALERWPSAALHERAAGIGPLVGPGLAIASEPSAAALGRLESLLAGEAPVDLASWEPLYGRLAEAQVKWEAAHGRPLPTG